MPCNILPKQQTSSASRGPLFQEYAPTPWLLPYTEIPVQNILVQILPSILKIVIPSSERHYIFFF
jgi:hypothetical protein